MPVLCVLSWADASVALLTEGVDRNRLCQPHQLRRMVALLTEGVDRNCVSTRADCVALKVALLTEGVDRNQSYLHRRARA